MDKAELIGKINEILDELQPVLVACRIKVTPVVDTAREKRLQAVYADLQLFKVSDALVLFKAAEALRPPGVLALWNQDKNLRDAREVRIYRDAIQLVRDTWCELPHLFQFFRKGQKRCPTQTKEPSTKHKHSPDNSECQEPAQDKVTAT